MKRLYILFLIPVLFGCSSENSNKTGGNNLLEGKVEIDGSSTVYPISEAIAEEFNAEYPRVRATIGVSGTGGGFAKFIRNEIDIATASRTIKKSEDDLLHAAGIEFIELPIAYDGLAVVVNKENDWVNEITVKELKKLWEPAAQGKIKTWNQIRSTWPNQEVHLFGAGTQSGTFDYFTEAIMGKSKSSRGDYTASEDDNVLVQGISSDKLALGFFGLDYYVANKEKLKLVPVNDEDDSNGKGAIAPSEVTVKDGTYQPLSRPLFIYVNKKSLEKEPVKVFLDFAIENAHDLVSEAGYVPLTKEIYGLVKQRLDNKTAGSVFLHVESNIGVKIDELLKVNN